jgi:hypothetical protein
MLKFLSVGHHGRDFRTLSVACAILTLTWVAALRPQSSPEFDDLLPELATKIAAVVASDSQVSLTASVPDSSAARRLQDGIARLLASRGVRVVEAGDAITAVGLSCSDNLRERSCLAEVQRNTRRDVVMVTRRHEGTTGVARPSVSLELRPLLARRTPILDALPVGERLLVLDPTSIALYQRTGQEWEPTRSRPLPLARVWPRDLRGRLKVEGDRFVAFLPGVICSGSVNELAVQCADGRQPWPLGLENTGLVPARNYFDTPEGLSFYSAAALGAEADARWLVADRNGSLSLLDADRRPLVRVAPAADDVVAITSACGAESFVIAAGPSDGRASLQLFQVARQRMISIGFPVFAPGKLTALWAAPGATAATAVAHDISGGRYEAFLITLSCGR